MEPIVELTIWHLNLNSFTALVRLHQPDNSFHTIVTARPECILIDSFYICDAEFWFYLQFLKIILSKLLNRFLGLILLVVNHSGNYLFTRNFVSLLLLFC